MWSLWRFDRVTAKKGEAISASNAKPFYKVILRAFIMSPVGALGIALCCTVIGAPLGIPILIWAGKWIAAPIQQHPNFRIPTQQEQLIARQRREGSYVEDQYMNTSNAYPTPSNWMDEL